MNEGADNAARASATISALLDRTLELRERLAPYLQRFEPPPGSVAASVWNSGDVCRLAFIHAQSMLAVALDHLMLWRAAYNEARFQPSFAHLTLVRTALETTAIARWLLDPEISEEVRMARGVAVQELDWTERDKYEMAITKGKPAPRRQGKARSARHRLDVNSRLRRRYGIRELKVNVVDIADLYLVSKPGVKAGAVVWRLLGAPAHGKQWAIMPYSEVRAVDVKLGGASINLVADDAVAFGVLHMAVSSLEAAIGDVERLM